LNDEARELIQQLGSKAIKSLAFRDSWVFVGAKGIDNTLFEKVIIGRAFGFYNYAHVASHSRVVLLFVLDHSKKMCVSVRDLEAGAKCACVLACHVAVAQQDGLFDCAFFTTQFINPKRVQQPAFHKCLPVFEDGLETWSVQGRSFLMALPGESTSE